MGTQSATTTTSYAVTVAGGVFGPGHLGELTQYLPFELVHDVLEQTRTVQRRLRVLPSRVGVYFVLALGMFPRLGYLRVSGKLAAGLTGLDLPRPSEKALRDQRRRHPLRQAGRPLRSHPSRRRHQRMAPPRLFKHALVRTP